ncbi:MAG: hypothetical protein EP350_10090 [Alphaproteobacteria bacterium]|nr:MAG: hypothetical protein EP350_10090 [Alphaproteobacteria bacterium]
MSALEHPDQIRAMRRAAQSRRSASAPPLEARWTALHAQAREIGHFAALAKEPFDGQIASFPKRIVETGGAALDLAQRGIEDIDAVLRPGLAALRAIHARGQEPTAPALALWREFHAARHALLSLCPEQ